MSKVVSFVRISGNFNRKQNDFAENRREVVCHGDPQATPNLRRPLQINRILAFAPAQGKLKEPLIPRLGRAIVAVGAAWGGRNSARKSFAGFRPVGKADKTMAFRIG
jgi:hypothetical protein